MALRAGRSSCSIAAAARSGSQQACVLAHVEIAPVGVICETLSLGRGKDINMIATRPAGRFSVPLEDRGHDQEMVADMLEELGYSVAAEAGEINEAIRLAQTTDSPSPFSTSTSTGKVISPVAELIKARNRPFIFATGYAPRVFRKNIATARHCKKPFQLETLAR